MFTPISRRGGARIGWLRFSWPFATLTITQSMLKLSVALIGDYAFTCEQVIAIEPNTFIPMISGGIRIRHNVSDLPRMIMFYWNGNPDDLINTIRSAGFLPIARSESVSVDRDVPFRLSTIAVSLLIWGSVYLFGAGYVSVTIPSVWIALLAFVLLFVVTTATLRNHFVQGMVLKKGRSINEIIAWLRFLRLLSVIMSVVFFLFIAAGHK